MPQDHLLNALNKRQPILRGTILLCLSIYLIQNVVSIKSIEWIPLLTTCISIAHGFFSFGLHQMEPFATDWFRKMDFMCIPIQMSMIFFSYLNVSRHYYYNLWIVISEILFVSVCLGQLIMNNGSCNWWFHVSLACMYIPFVYWLYAATLPILFKTCVALISMLNIIGFLFFVCEYNIKSFEDDNQRPFFVCKPNSGQFGNHEIFHLFIGIGTLIFYKFVVVPSSGSLPAEYMLRTYGHIG